MAHVLATAHTSLSTSPSYQFRQHYAVGRSVALTTTDEGKRVVFRQKNDARAYYSQSITREGSKVYGTLGKGKVGQRMAMWVNRRVNQRYVR
jgi:hypothetical protein